VICRKYLISGRVQGVYYRDTAAQHARELGIRGYAKNLADGRVEVLACGAEADLQAFLQALWAGSSASKVTAIETLEEPLDAGSVPHRFHTA
jgi:acylphosphatase